VTNKNWSRHNEDASEEIDIRSGAGRKASKNPDKPRTRNAMSRESAGMSWKGPCTPALARLIASDIRIDQAPRGHLRIKIASRNAAGTQ
jgi:hypothetical protein